MTERCKEKIFDPDGGLHEYPCSRKAVIDGYCKQHHPDNVKARRKKLEEKWHAKAERIRRKNDCQQKALALLGRLESMGIKNVEAIPDLIEVVRNVLQLGIGSSFLKGSMYELKRILSHLEEGK